MNPQSDTSLSSDSAQAYHGPPSQKTTVSSHSKTWKGKMAAGVKKIGLPFRKKAPDETASLQTMETGPESSYMYEKPEESTLMSLEEESSPTEAMKYASQVQHQEPSKESGYNQMPGAMWEVAAAAQIVQTTGVPGQQTSTPSSHEESPSWQEAAQQWKASQGIRRGIPQSQESKALGPQPAPPAGYPGTQQMGLDESMGSTLHDVIRCQSLAQANMFQTLQSNLTPENKPNLRAWADTFGEPMTARISPVESTSSIGGTLDTIIEEENPIPLTLPRSSGAQTPYYPTEEDPWREQTDTDELLEQHPHADSPPWQHRVLFTDTNKEDTVLWWFTGAQSLAGTTNIGLTAGARSADAYGTWPEPDIMKLDLTQSSNLSSTPNPPSMSNPPLYHKESFSGGSMRERTSTKSLKNTEGTSHMSGTGTRYGSMETPISYDMNPSFTQPTISTDWTHGLEPRYKSTGSPVRENMPMMNPSLTTPMRKVTSSSKDPVEGPTDEELYKMNWDQFWWHMHDQPGLLDFCLKGVSWHLIVMHQECQLEPKCQLTPGLTNPTGSRAGSYDIRDKNWRGSEFEPATWQNID
ncbi:uncharacterized protein EV420DRAFT_1634945 [Desarmillaria tabescens]|uniref:Uncharacterized protein n=1 Tax=Armillaria tabescens TaxID=1929756 RepID=A0AA39NLJ7_ARMTA|nr:uncharacterized protein EV420DRAFT_1634945 [Desarmillaria tabescens]KAK0467693.1 hypothetical protein EV420DRAFT_1634945 [Desarmillaria tabescens]